MKTYGGVLCNIRHNNYLWINVFFSCVLRGQYVSKWTFIYLLSLLLYLFPYFPYFYNCQQRKRKTYSLTPQNIYFCFIDYTKAFDYKLWKILKDMVIPDYLTCLLRNLYVGQEATVRTGHGTTDWFQIEKGVRPGCLLSPCFFNLYVQYRVLKSRAITLPTNLPIVKTMVFPVVIYGCESWSIKKPEGWRIDAFKL